MLRALHSPDTVYWVDLNLPQKLSGLSDRTFFLLNTSILVGKRPVAISSMSDMPFAEGSSTHSCGGVVGARVSMEVIRFFQAEKHVVLRHTEQGKP